MPAQVEEEEILHVQLKKEIIKALCQVYDNHKHFYRYLVRLHSVWISGAQTTG